MAKKQTENKISKEETLALWTYRLATMFGSGICIMTALKVLEEEETSYGLQEVTRGIADKIERGESLNKAMQSWPEYFDEDYIGSVKAGEHGGVLDETMNRLAEQVLKGLRTPNNIKIDQLSRFELAEWCWRFGSMLSAGTSLLSALEVLSGSGHPVLRDISSRMRQEVVAGYAFSPLSGESDEARPKSVIMHYPGIFTPTLRVLTGIGEEYGSLNQTLKRAAEQLDYEAKLEAEGKLPLLSAKPDEPLPPAPFEEPGIQPHVVRRVNELLGAALNADAEAIELRATDDDNGQAILIKEGKGGEAIPLENYSHVISRIKIIAEIDPFIEDERRATIYIRHEGKDYRVLVRSMPLHPGKPLSLHIRKGSQAVQM